jgi:glycosyltransferase involved in cell wall biosynthesis
MKPKIAFFRKGPIPIACQRVADLLQANFPGHQVEIIDLKDVLRGRKDLLARGALHAVKDYGLEVLRRRKTLSEAFFATTYVFQAIKRLAEQHLSQGGYEFSFQMLSLFDASLAGLPHFVYTDHTVLANLHYPDGKRYLYSRRWIELEGTIYQHARLNFTWSEFVRQSIIEQYACAADRVVRVYAGYNTPDPDLTGLPDGRWARKNVLFVGIDWKRKGGPQLLEAFREVLKTHPDATLTIVGCKPEVVVPRVRVVGRVSLERVAALYREASVFCLPTRLDPAPAVLLEAMSYQLPVVTTAMGALPEFVLEGETGRLVPPGDVHALAQALNDLLSDPQACRSMGERGHQRVREEFTWPRAGVELRDHILASLG